MFARCISGKLSAAILGKPSGENFAEPMKIPEKSLSKHSSSLQREYQKAILVIMERYNNGMYRKPSQFLKEEAAIGEEKKRY